MKSLIENFQTNQVRSFNVREIQIEVGEPYLRSHEVFELSLIMNCNGKRFLGDSIEDFESDEIVFMGPNLPHCWQVNSGFHAVPSAVVLHFPKTFFDNLYKLFPEFKTLHLLSKAANQGIIFNTPNKTLYRSKFFQISRCTDSALQVVRLLELFYSLTQEPYSLKASEGYSLKSNKEDFEKINKVYEFVYANYQQDISLNELAALIHLSKTSFCRYFRKKTRKSFFTFLKEIRIIQACKLLIESEKSISEIGYNSGYNTLANFNKQFKEVTGLNPLKYREKYQQ